MHVELMAPGNLSQSSIVVAPIKFTRNFIFEETSLLGGPSKRQRIGKTTLFLKSWVVDGGMINSVMPANVCMKGGNGQDGSVDGWLGASMKKKTTEENVLWPRIVKYSPVILTALSTGLITINLANSDWPAGTGNLAESTLQK